MATSAYNQLFPLVPNTSMLNHYLSAPVIIYPPNYSNTFTYNSYSFWIQNVSYHNGMARKIVENCPDYFNEI